MIKLLYLFFTIVLMVGCMSHSVHQTAEILDKDDLEIGFALSTYPNGYVNDDFHIRFPLSEYFELGLGSSLILRGFDADLKFQMLRLGEAHQQFAVAFQAKPSVSLSNNNTYSNFAIGLLISKRLSSQTVIYSRFAYIIPINEYEDLEASDYEPYYQEDFKDLITLNAFVKYQATLGVSFEGNQFFIRPEVNFLYIDRKISDIWIMPSLQIGSFL